MGLLSCNVQLLVFKLNIYLVKFFVVSFIFATDLFPWIKIIYISDKVMAAYRREMTVGLLPVHRDQLRTQQSTKIK